MAQKQAPEVPSAQAGFPNACDILMDAPIGIFTSTPDGRFISANPAMARMYGYDSPTDMVGAVTDIAQQIYVNPADRFQLHNMLENADHCPDRLRHDRSPGKIPGGRDGRLSGQAGTDGGFAKGVGADGGQGIRLNNE